MKYMLITGAGGGLAEAVIKLFKKDFCIFALDISPQGLQKYSNEENIKTFICDLTDTRQIEAVKQEVLQITPTIDVIINLAGATVMGSAIEISPAVFEKIMAINMFATYRINYTFFPLIKKPGGRVINVSSEYAKYLGIPFHSFYTASKRANDIYSDSLRRELKRFKVKVVKIRPGAFDTDMVKNVNNQFDQLVQSTQYYKEPLLKMKNIMTNEIKGAKNPNKIAKTFAKAVYSKRPKLTYDVGNSFKMRLFTILPACLQDWLLTKFF